MRGDRLKRGWISVRGKLANAGLFAAGRLSEKNLKAQFAGLGQKPFALTRMDKDTLESADVISFDLFDTLIFRDVSNPRVIFDLCGTVLNFQGFREARVNAEREIRASRQREVTLEEIYELLEERYGLSKNEGMELECRLEREHCVPNVYMKRVFEEVAALCRRQGKQCVIISDMYLPETAVEEMIKACGYSGYDRLFLSSTSGRKKADGTLFGLVREQLGTDKRYVHIGDHVRSDVEMAQKAGFQAVWYPNIHAAGITAEKLKVNAVTGSLYASLVNRTILAGGEQRSPAYRCGYVYYGIVVYGYCQWLHSISMQYGAQAVWFAARDMKVVSEVYRCLFPDEATEYLPVSRLAMLKANQPKMAGMFLKNMEQALDTDTACTQVLGNMKLEALGRWLEGQGVNLSGRSRDSREQILRILKNNSREAARCLEPERRAALEYLGTLRTGCTILFADLNGRSTSAMAAEDLLHALGLECSVICAQLYTTTQGELFDARAAAEDTLVWLFSPAHERHHRAVFSRSWSRNAAIMEAVFTEEKGTLLSYRRNDKGELMFAPGRAGDSRLPEIHRGIRDFARDFHRVWSGISKTGQIDRELAYTALSVGLQDECAGERTVLTMGN